MKLHLEQIKKKGSAKKMKRWLLKFSVSLSFIISMSLFLTVSAFASTPVTVGNVTPSTMKPAASGGGCNPFGTSSWSGDIVASGCISYGWPYLYPDGYATIKPISAVWSCNVAIQLYDTSGNYLAGQSYSCAYGRQAHYGPISSFTLSGSYYACIDIHLSYVNGAASSATSCSYYIHV